MHVQDKNIKNCGFCFEQINLLEYELISKISFLFLLIRYNKTLFSQLKYIHNLIKVKNVILLDHSVICDAS